jgi:hypothetical protein
MALVLPQWVSADELMRLLEKYRGNSDVFGDFYVRFR